MSGRWLIESKEFISKAGSLGELRAYVKKSGLFKGGVLDLRKLKPATIGLSLTDYKKVDLGRIKVTKVSDFVFEDTDTHYLMYCLDFKFKHGMMIKHGAFNCADHVQVQVSLAEDGNGSLAGSITYFGSSDPKLVFKPVKFKGGINVFHLLEAIGSCLHQILTKGSVVGSDLYYVNQN